MRWYIVGPAMLLFFTELDGSLSLMWSQPLSLLPDLLEGALLFIAWGGLIWYGRRRAWRNYVRLHGAVSGRVGDQGLEWKTESTTTSMNWGKLLGYKALSDLTLIYYAPRCAFFLPRGFFKSDEQWSAMQALLAQHLKKK